jgi:hypothetical protein
VHVFSDVLDEPIDMPEGKYCNRMPGEGNVMVMDRDAIPVIIVDRILKISAAVA